LVIIHHSNGSFFLQYLSARLEAVKVIGKRCVSSRAAQISCISNRYKVPWDSPVRKMHHLPVHFPMLAQGSTPLQPLERYDRPSPQGTASQAIPAQTNQPELSGDVELIIRQQPKEALVTAEGKEKGLCDKYETVCI
jgi:hypothetical protein